MRLDSASYQDILWALANVGKSMNQIGREVGCSPARVRQILMTHGKLKHAQPTAYRKPVIRLVRKYIRPIQKPSSANGHRPERRSAVIDDYGLC